MILEAEPKIEIDYSVPGIQGIFNNVWKHFIVKGGKPGLRAVSNNNGSTSYRCDYGAGRETSRCAIGIFDTKRKLNTNEIIDELIEGEEQPVIQEMFDPFSISVQEDLNGAFLVELQVAHDSSALIKTGITTRPETLERFKNQLQERLEAIATKYELVIPQGVSEHV